MIGHPALELLRGIAPVAACEYDPDHAAGYAARIRAATSHTRLFDRMASVRDWEGCPTAMTRSDFMRARLFCLMLPSGSLSAVPDATDSAMSAATRDTLARIGDADGRVSWTEYLILSALLSAPARELSVALASGDEDGSGLLNHRELCRSLAFLVESELVASGDDLGEANADRWCAAAASSSAGSAHAQSLAGSREVQPPLGIARAALAPRASEIPANPTPEQLAADRYAPAAILSLAAALRRAVAELEFRVFVQDSPSERAKLPVVASAASGGADPPRRMSPAAFARFVVCQSHAGPSSMATMLQAWGQRVGSDADSQQSPPSSSSSSSSSSGSLPLDAAAAAAGAQAAVGAPSNVETATSSGGGARVRDPRLRFGSMDPRDSLSFEEFLPVRAAMVDRSGQVVASLRMAVAAAGSAAVTPQMLVQAVWAVNGAELPRAAAEAVLAVAAPGQPGHEATAPLESLATLLAEHAAASVGRRRAAGEGGFLACVRGDTAGGRS